MSAIIGTFVAVKTMADLTPRITLDLQCTLAEFTALGLTQGAQFAVARLTNDAANAALAQKSEPAPEPAKGGALAKLAGMWCNDQDFQGWLSVVLAREVDAADAARMIRLTCGVDSRAELDSNEKAAAIFNEKFRLPYMAYCQGRTK